MSAGFVTSDQFCCQIPTAKPYLCDKVCWYVMPADWWQKPNRVRWYNLRLAAEIEQLLLFCMYLNCDVIATEKSLKMIDEFLFLYIFILRIILNMIISKK